MLSQFTLLVLALVSSVSDNRSKWGCKGLAFSAVLLGFFSSSVTLIMHHKKHSAAVMLLNTQKFSTAIAQEKNHFAIL